MTDWKTNSLQIWRKRMYLCNISNWLVLHQRISQCPPKSDHQRVLSCSLEIENGLSINLRTLLLHKNLWLWKAVSGAGESTREMCSCSYMYLPIGERIENFTMYSSEEVWHWDKCFPIYSTAPKVIKHRSRRQEKCGDYGIKHSKITRSSPQKWDLQTS